MEVQKMALTVTVQTDYTFQELWNSVPCYSEANETLAIIHEYGMDNDFMEYANAYFINCAPSMETMIAWLDYDREITFKAIGLDYEAWEAEKA